MPRCLSVSVVIIAMLEINMVCVSSNWNMMIVQYYRFRKKTDLLQQKTKRLFKISYYTII